LAINEIEKHKFNNTKHIDVMGLRRLLNVRETNDRVLMAFHRVENDSDDGIYFHVVDKNAGPTTSGGNEIPALLIVRRSEIFPNESVENLLVDTNHIAHPTGYIISLCFSTFDNNKSKLYMGRVSISGSNVSWTQCADSPKIYNDEEILRIISYFLDIGEGRPTKQLKVRNVNTGDESLPPPEHH
jgi:hypothetical protein